MNCEKPTVDDVISSEAAMAGAWLKLQRAMLSDSGDRRSSCAVLLDAIDVERHVSRRFYGGVCPDVCWVCKKATAP